MTFSIEALTGRNLKLFSEMSKIDMSTDPKLAKEIAEDLLHRTGDALISGDFEAFIDCFHLPHSVLTANGENKLETAADAERVFKSVREFHKRAGVTEMVRNSIAAEFCDPDTINATHETRLLSQNRFVEEPYPVFSVLRKIDGKWVGVSSEYAIPPAAKTLSTALDSKSGTPPESCS